MMLKKSSRKKIEREHLILFYHQITADRWKRYRATELRRLSEINTIFEIGIVYMLKLH